MRVPAILTFSILAIPSFLAAQDPKAAPSSVPLQPAAPAAGPASTATAGSQKSDTAETLLQAAALASRTPGDTVLRLVAASCRPPFQALRGNSSNECQIGDTLFVAFENLENWKNVDPVGHDPSKLVLALNGHILAGTHPNSPVVNANLLSFDMAVPEGSSDDAVNDKQAWREILRKHDSKDATLRVSVGFKGTPSFYSGAGRPIFVNFRIYPRYSRAVFIGVGLLILLLAWLAAKTNLIRSGPPRPDGTPAPFSLGRAQMAWWFMIVVHSYIYIWLITDNRDSLTQGVLILIGISAATGLGSQIAGGGKPGAAPDSEAVSPPAAGAPEPNAPTSPPPPPVAAAPAATRSSRGFLLDILGDEDGVSFDRLQMVGWTLVLGLVFVVQVYSDLNMPDFSPTLLGLMGISSGTYIGFKLPNKG